MPSHVNLDGAIISEDASKISAEDIQIWKSVLQKAIRRGIAEKAMCSAYKLSTEQTGEVLKRLLRGYGTWDG